MQFNITLYNTGDIIYFKRTQLVLNKYLFCVYTQLQLQNSIIFWVLNRTHQKLIILATKPLILVSEVNICATLFHLHV